MRKSSWKRAPLCCIYHRQNGGLDGVGEVVSLDGESDSQDSKKAYLCTGCGQWGDRHWLFMTGDEARDGSWGRVPTHLMYHATTDKKARHIALRHSLRQLIKRIP